MTFLFCVASNHLRHAAKKKIFAKMIGCHRMNRLRRSLDPSQRLQFFEELLMPLYLQEFIELKRIEIQKGDAPDGEGEALVLQGDFHQRSRRYDMKVWLLFVEIAKRLYRPRIILNLINEEKCLSGKNSNAFRDLNVSQQLLTRRASLPILSILQKIKIQRNELLKPFGKNINNSRLASLPRPTKHQWFSRRVIF